MVADAAASDVILTDSVTLKSADERVQLLSPDSSNHGNTAKGWIGDEQTDTEWILLTSGTTGPPKLVVHTLASLSAPIDMSRPSSAPTVWATYYDIRRYGGLQIFLRAALTGTTLVLRNRQESTATFIARAGTHGVTHMSGTPSHWRSALMSAAADRIAPSYVRLSGEIADQSILDQLQLQYPHAKIAHAFASTEAGVAFEVNDGIMGFPSSALALTPHVEMKVENSTLRIRSNRMASRYLNASSQSLRDAQGYIDTRDVLELRDDRYYFAGRQDGMINVGGFKVHPEEVEAVINRHPNVAISLVRAKKSPITGELVTADVVLKAPRQSAVADGSLQREILDICRDQLSVYKVPVTIQFVTSLEIADTGKLIRNHA